ncbi:hypothetical protein BJX70DRAFT_397782 [Aspergillus crustosus]
MKTTQICAILASSYLALPAAAAGTDNIPPTLQNWLSDIPSCAQSCFTDFYRQSLRNSCDNTKDDTAATQCACNAMESHLDDEGAKVAPCASPACDNDGKLVDQALKGIQQLAQLCTDAGDGDSYSSSGSSNATSTSTSTTGSTSSSTATTTTSATETETGAGSEEDSPTPTNGAAKNAGRITAASLLFMEGIFAWIL